MYGLAIMQSIEKSIQEEISSRKGMKIKILAMSQMNKGICIAGVNEINQWVRPIKSKPSHNTVSDENLRFNYPHDIERLLKGVDKSHISQIKTITFYLFKP